MSSMDRLAKQILKEVSLDNIVPRADSPSGPTAHWTQPVLLERAAYLRQLARYGNGEVSETLRESPSHAAMLVVRNRSGEAELHARHAHLFCVLSGCATLATGGRLAGAQQIAKGITRADALEGGEHLELRAGDVIHVPAGVPYRLLISGEKAISCLVVRIQEAEE